MRFLWLVVSGWFLEFLPVVVLAQSPSLRRNVADPSQSINLKGETRRSFSVNTAIFFRALPSPFTSLCSFTRLDSRDQADIRTATPSASTSFIEVCNCR
jgi:hypothetical protein